MVRQTSQKRTFSDPFAFRQTSRPPGTFFLCFSFGQTLQRPGGTTCLYDHERTQRSAARLKNHYFNQGYFNTKVRFELDTLKPKKITTSYQIQTGKPYFYDSISTAIQSSELAELYTRNRRPSLIKKGDQYNAAKLDNERERITSFFRNNGAYDFQKTYINYEIDTLKNNHTADLLVNIDNKNIKDGDTLRTEPFKLYKISEVNVFTRNNSKNSP